MSGTGRGCFWKGGGKEGRWGGDSTKKCSIWLLPHGSPCTARRWSFTARHVRQPCVVSAEQGSIGSMAQCCCGMWWSSTRQPYSASLRPCVVGRHRVGTWAGEAMGLMSSQGQGRGTGEGKERVWEGQKKKSPGGLK